jgi:hypothetical protein
VSSTPTARSSSPSPTSPGQANPDLQARRAALQAQLVDLQRRQANLVRELSDYRPTGNTDLDTA